MKEALEASERVAMGRRSLAIDVLRALAVGLVLVHHARPWRAGVPLPRPISNALITGGWIGVDLFFVLSGFLIAGLLFREHQRFGVIRYRHFILRRGLKIYPAFYVFLGATVIGTLMRGGDVPNATVPELLFVQNYFGSIWGHTWSLAIEEHFYLLLPVLLILLARRRAGETDPFSRIPAIFLVVAALALALRIAAAATSPFNGMTHLKPTHLRIDSLMFGVLLSYLFHYRREQFEAVCTRYFWPMLITGTWLLVPSFLFQLSKTPFLYTLGFTQIFVGSGLIMSALVVRGIPSNRLTRAIGYCGTFSYSIYLWHMMVRWWGMDWFYGMFDRRPSIGLGLTVYLVVSVAGGILMAHLIEFPVLRLRDRLLPSRSNGSPLAPAAARPSAEDQGEVLHEHEPASPSPLARDQVAEQR